MRSLLSATLLLLTVSVPCFAVDSETPRPSMPSGTQLFQVALLVGSTSGAEATEGLPKNAEKAIADIRDFLPFKRYKLLDSGLIRTVEGMNGSLLMDGVSAQQYRVSLSFRNHEKRSGSLSIYFFTVDPISTKSRTLAPGEAPSAQSKSLISTSFSLDVGETIVVGSSKLGGGEALVVLLTAIPPNR